MQSSSTTYTSSSSSSAPMVERVLLPTQIVEKPVAIHEEIRRETIEEVQPIFNVEKLKTEIHQVTQPLFDKEVRSVNIENRTLATEILPEVLVQGRGARTAEEMSTTQYMNTQTVVVEKPAMIREVEKRQIIEEIQPVIYKETIVPTVIQETKPIYQKIVEGPVYTQETLASRGVSNPSVIHESYVTDRSVVAPINERMVLPTQYVEKPVAVHETIRKEMIEEIQPVVNVEKLKTEVHQVTQPLFDKEIMPVTIEKRVLNQEILPEVQVMGRGARAVDDMSSTQYMDTKTVFIEKPAIFNEVERTQIIEEIQPVVYKETVVPTVIRETKPIYQKIVEGPVYTHQTLPAQSLHGSHYSYPTQHTEQVHVQSTVPVVVQREVTPVVQVAHVPVQVAHVPVQVAHVPVQVAHVPAAVVVPVVEHHRKEVITDTVTTTTTTSVAPTLGAQPMTHEKQHHSLFHRHDKTQDAHNTHNTTGMVNNSLPTGDRHVERIGPNGERIVEDVHSTTHHTQRTL